MPLASISTSRKKLQTITRRSMANDAQNCSTRKRPGHQVQAEMEEEADLIQRHANVRRGNFVIVDSDQTFTP
jgi:hypothetical protein